MNLSNFSNFIPFALKYLEKMTSWQEMTSKLLYTFSFFAALGGTSLSIYNLTKLSGASFIDVVGVIIFNIFLILGVACVAQIAWLRADSVKSLNKEKYFMSEIVSVLFKFFGEATACFVMAVSVGGAVLIWFIGNDAGVFSSGLPIFMPSAKTYFLVGLGTVAYGVLISFLALLTSYLMAETTVFIARILSSIESHKEERKFTTVHEHDEAA